jgi:N utilization substance protein B
MVRGTLEAPRADRHPDPRAAANWRLERMPPVDRNILRLAVYEMLCEIDVPKLVVMDEAIELAKKYGSEQSGRFVNGLLDGLLKAHSFPGSLREPPRPSRRGGAAGRGGGRPALPIEGTDRARIVPPSGWCSSPTAMPATP